MAMKAIIFTACACIALPISVNGQQGSTVPPVAKEGKQAWSLVYLPSLNWTEKEIGQTVRLIAQVKPDLIVSLAACPFAEAVRILDCKPALLDSATRSQSGQGCDLPAEPWSSYAGSSTLHSFGGEDGAKGQLVWLAAKAVKQPFHGPFTGEEELRALAHRQVRKQFAERHGDVVFLVDSSIPTPPEESWAWPMENVHYEQSACDVSSVLCIRPQTLRSHLDEVRRITPRMPLVHWIHSEKGIISWEVLPIDGGPAVQRLVSSKTAPRGGAGRILWLKGPESAPGMPVWLDDYINNNHALGCGNNLLPSPVGRRFGWTEARAERDPFDVLGSIDHAAEGKTKASDLPRGAVRSPGNLFSVTVGQLDEKGIYPTEGDDGINVYLDDLRGAESRLLYFQGMYGAWPSAATWFTDRYVITSGTAPWVDLPADTDKAPRFHPLTLRVFDLLSGRSFVASGMGRSDGAVHPTEEIVLPAGDYPQQEKWRSLWKAVEYSYLATPEKAPLAVGDAARGVNLAAADASTWTDLGVWPPPETWHFTPEPQEDAQVHPPQKVIPTQDPYLICKQTGDGNLQYSLNIASNEEYGMLDDRGLETNLIARAPLLIAGEEGLPKVETVRRMGENKQHLLMAGSYQKPGTDEPGNGKWMLLLDLVRHRAWSVHW